MQRDVLATMVPPWSRRFKSGGSSSTAPSRPTSIWPAACRNRGSNWISSCASGSRWKTPPAAPVVVESYPTPISRAVDGPEAHLLIANGRVVFVRIEPLLEQFKSQAKRQATSCRDQPELTDTVGPVGGFRLRYTLERHDISPETMKETGRGGSYAPAAKMDARSRLERPGRAGAAGLGAGLRLPPGAGEDFAGPDRRSRSGSIPTASTPSARFARSCIGWATRLPPGRCRPARPSAARRKGASRPHSEAVAVAGRVASDSGSGELMIRLRSSQ